MVLAGWLAGAAFVACSSFSATAPDDGSSDSGNGAGNDGSVVEGGGDAVQGPACPAADTTCDPSNCGRPAHSCLGGACVAGQCQPAVLATTTAMFAYGPVLDSARAAIATHTAAGSRVEWCPKAGCPGGLLGVDLPTLATSPRSMVSDGTSVYVSTFGGQSAGVFRITQAGLAQPITPIDGTFQNADELALDGADVLFINAFQAGPIGIYRVSTMDGVITQIVPVQPVDRWAHLVAPPGRIYAADFESITTCSGPTCPSLVPYAAPAVAHVDVTGLVTDGTALFWTSDQKELLMCPLGATCAASTVVVGTTALEGSIPIALSIQGPDLYVTTAAGAIFTCPAASCAPSTFTRVATDEVVEGPAAADDSAVYWVGRQRIDAGGGLQTYRLMRLAK